MLALIDSDILVYRVGFTTQEEPVEIAKARIDEQIQKILEKTEASSYKCFLTASNDSTAFRRIVYPEYKAHRKADKPIHYQALREHLINNHNAEVVTTIEADDILGITQYNTKDTIIVSIDKDLDMIPGLHYNFVKEIIYSIDECQALYNFYKQLLMGDTADNVKGVEGIGPKKAYKILETAFTEEEMFGRVREAYSNDAEMLKNGEALWILRHPFPEGRWRFTEFGMKLVPEITPCANSLCTTTNTFTGCIGEERLPDGFLQDGLIQLDCTTLSQGGSPHLT